MQRLAVALAVTALVQLAPPVPEPSMACAGTVYDFQLVGEGAVIARHGIQTANPSVIRVPDWIPPGERPNASANYYMYYGVHREHYIRMKWAETLDGPWAAFDLGTTHNGHSRHGVFDPSSDSTRASYTHVFAPDVHVDDVNERIIMYYHGENQAATTTPGGTPVPRNHSNFVATSQYGLNFNDPATAGGEAGHGPVSVTYDTVTRDVLLGEDYQHVFEYKGDFYSVAKRGILDKAPDPNNPWAPPPDNPGTSEYEPFEDEAWIRENTPSALWTNDANPGGQTKYISPGATFLASSEFANHPNNPLPGKRIFSDSADDSLRMNHTAVNLLPAEEQLEVFFYVRANYASSLTDSFDSTYRIVYDVSDPDFQNWTVAIDDTTGEYMFDVVVTDDEITAAVEAAHPGGVNPDLYADPSALGAPAILVDDDGSKYLFYTYYSAANGGNTRASEGQISAVRLLPASVPTDTEWASASGGNWQAGPWTEGLPSTTLPTVFGDSITQDITIYTDADVDVSGIEFDNENTFVIAGAGTVTLTIDPDAPDNPSMIAVLKGDHEFQVPVSLANDLEVIVADGASLTLHNLDLGGYTLTQTGTGILNINSRITGGGTIILPETPGLQSVPEPGSLLLLILGAAALAPAVRRSKRRKKSDQYPV